MKKCALSYKDELALKEYAESKGLIYLYTPFSRAVANRLNDMESALKHKNIKNYELVKGDICQTLPKYTKQNPHQKIALLHIDTDIYEPCVCILEHCYERVIGGG